MEESERQRIVDLYKQTKSGRKVTKQVDWSRSTVYKVLRQEGVCRTAEEYHRDSRKSLKEGYDEMDEKLAYIFGVLITDGYTNDAGIGLETIDDEFVNRFQQFCEKKFGIEGNRYKGESRTHELDGQIIESGETEIVRISSVNLLKYIESVDLIEEIRSLENREHQLKALKGMWDSDGSLNVEGRQILFYKKDEDVIEVYEYLLDQLFNFSYNTRWGGNGAYVCYFGTKDSVRRFYNEVDPTIERKQERLETMMA